jgi:hypothetical protein
MWSETMKFLQENASRQCRGQYEPQSEKGKYEGEHFGRRFAY